MVGAPRLVLSISIMALGSLVIAVMPTRETIGGAAAILLTLCRLVQGFATGGEYGTSATYMSEAATRNRRGFLSSFQYVTLVGGHVMAQFTLLILQGVLTKQQLSEWGWRIPFLIGAVAAVVVFWLRQGMDESLSAGTIDAATHGQDHAAGSLRELFANYWKPLLLVVMITLGGTVAFYTYSINGPAIIKTAYKDQGSTGTWLNLLSLIFLMVIQPIGGLLSDRVGRKPLLVGFGVGGLFYTWVLLTYLPQTKNPMLSFLLIAVGYVILTGYTSINALVKAEQFPAHIRALGVGLGYGVANSAFGGTAPLIYQAMKQANMMPQFIAYVTICIALSLITYVFFLRNREDTALDREQGSAFTPAAAPVRT